MPENIVKQHYSVKKENRRKLNGHHSAILWFTGLSGAGKSTLAQRVEEELYNRGIRTYVLDGDNMRRGLNNNLGFSHEDRTENIRRIGEVAKLFVDSGVMVLSAFISPYQADRDNVRGLVETNEFIEVFVKCPVSVCENRDVKGLYKKARQGIIKHFTGIDDPYEEPLNPEVVVETDLMNIDQSVEKVLQYLREKNYISDGQVSK